MARTPRLSTIGALIVCVISTQWSGPLFASEKDPSSSGAPSSPSVVNRDHGIFVANGPLGAASAQAWRGTPTFVPVDSTSFAQRGGYRGRGRGGRYGAAQTEIILGAVASIAGAAVLVYANRPECGTKQMASGCGYGTKVVGGAVLSAGLVGLLIGALTWR